MQPPESAGSSNMLEGKPPSPAVISCSWEGSTGGPRSWEQSARERAGTQREAPGTQQLAAHSLSLHREHTMKPRNIHLSVCFGAQHLRDVLGGRSSVPGGWAAPSRNSEGAVQPLLPAPLPLTPITLLVSEAHMSEEDIHMEMLDLPPPRLLPPSGLEAGNEDTDTSALLAEGTPLLPAPRGISRLHRSPKALLHPPRTRQGWKERTGCLSSHTTQTALLVLPARPFLKIHTNQPPAPVSSSPMPRDSLGPQGATGLCPPPHNVPQSNEPSTDVCAMSCSKSTPPKPSRDRHRGQHWPSRGRADSMRTVHLLRRKPAQSRDLVTVGTRQPWRGEAERH